MGAKKTCRNCGKEFDPEDTADECHYHPEESVLVGTTDSRLDYADIYKYPCCGQTEIYHPSYETPPGCAKGVHVARD